MPMSGEDALSFGRGVLNLLKGYIGVGLLGLPYVTRRAGWAIAVPGLVFVAKMALTSVSSSKMMNR